MTKVGWAGGREMSTVRSKKQSGKKSQETYSSPGNDNIFNNSHEENEKYSDSTGSNMSYFGIEFECEINEKLIIIRTKI